MKTCGKLIVELLEAYDFELVFGIPGAHTLELYRGLEGSSLRHISARHEQGAGFMADGYARASGKPAACFTITGPGATNIATPMGQAYAESVPMLVISSVTHRPSLGLGTGRLHELRAQRNLMSGVSAFAHTVLRPEELPQLFARAFAIFGSQRPRPVYFEVPVDVLGSSADGVEPRRVAIPAPPGPNPEAIAQAATLLKAAERPMLILGGGTADAGSEAKALAEALDAPVAITVNAKGVIPGGHPLLLGANMGYAPVRQAIAEADVVLAVGTELGETDRFPDTRDLEFNGKLVRVDLDSQQMTAGYLADVAMVADAALALSALRRALAGMEAIPLEKSPGVRRAADLREAIHQQWRDEIKVHSRLLHTLQQALPGLLLVGDSTQPAYSANYCFDPPQPRSYISSATGYGTLGHALPAAIGAKLSAPERPVVVLSGDGGFQFTLPELASAVDAEAPIIILLLSLIHI